MKLLSELRKELTDIVKNDSFLKDHINETEAIVSHFLQNISGEIPLLPKHKQAELLLHLNKKTNDDYDLFLGEASDELPNIEVPDLFNSLPYPPPKKWNFTFIDL